MFMMIRTKRQNVSSNDWDGNMQLSIHVTLNKSLTYSDWFYIFVLFFLVDIFDCCRGLEATANIGFMTYLYCFVCWKSLFFLDCVWLETGPVKVTLINETSVFPHQKKKKKQYKQMIVIFLLFVLLSPYIFLRLLSNITTEKIETTTYSNESW